MALLAGQVARLKNRPPLSACVCGKKSLTAIHASQIHTYQGVADVQENIFDKKQIKKFHKVLGQKYLMISKSKEFYKPPPIPFEKKLDITFSIIYYIIQ